MVRKKLDYKFRVGVLMGGRSVEREVSFNSGRTICDHIDSDRYEVFPIFQTVQGLLYFLPWKFLHRGKISDFEHRLSLEAKKIIWDDLRDLVDFVYIAVHGRYAEDGTLQGFLEVLNIPYLGSKVFGSAVGMDKAFQKRLLRMNGMCIPNDIVLTSKEIREKSLEEILALIKKQSISFPCIVKPSFEGSSLGISIVNSSNELLSALAKASWEDVTHEQQVLIEEKIEGMEFTSIALQKGLHSMLNIHEVGNWITLPATEVVLEPGTQFHDYEQKYMPGRSTKITPARCSSDEMQQIQNVSAQASDVLQFSTFFRIDGFFTADKNIVVIDPNSLSGMGPASFLFHQAAEVGMNHTELINYLINSELEQYGLLDDVIRYQEEKNMNSKMRKKIRVIVLFGGDSSEREISLESGRNICYKLSPSKYDVIPVFIDDSMRLYKLSARLLIQNSTRDIMQQISKEHEISWNDLPSLCDFVFIALHGGKGENGSVQGALEMLGLAYNGPGILTSSLCIDKYRTNCFLEKQGFVVPKSYLLEKSKWKRFVAQKNFSELCKTILKNISFPLIVKPHDDGCSMQVQKIDNIVSLEKTLHDYFSLDRKIALIEESVCGMELTCGVIGNDNITVLPPSYAVAAHGVLSIEEKFLPGSGENQTPAPLSFKETLFVQSVVKEVYNILGCKGYSRIDCFYQNAQISPTKEQRVVILEINTLPGMTPATCLFHQAAEVGIRPMELVDKIVELGFENHQHSIQKGDVVSKEQQN